MRTINQLGLDNEKTIMLSKKLNNLLADYIVFYQNVRGLYWNIKSEIFFELHVTFKELYTNLLLKVGEVPERILNLGETPLHTFDEYSNSSHIKSVKDMSQAEPAMKVILDGFQILPIKQRELLDLSQKANDEGTNALMNNYIRVNKKN